MSEKEINQNNQKKKTPGGLKAPERRGRASGRFSQGKRKRRRINLELLLINFFFRQRVRLGKKKIDACGLLAWREKRKRKGGVRAPERKPWAPAVIVANFPSDPHVAIYEKKKKNGVNTTRAGMTMAITAWVRTPPAPPNNPTSSPTLATDRVNEKMQLEHRASRLPRPMTGS